MGLEPLEIACRRVLERLQTGAHSDDIQPELDAALGFEPEIFHGRLKEEVVGVGPLTGLLGNESVTEIVMNGRESVWFETNGRFHLHPDVFLSELTFESFRTRLCSEAGISPDLNIPCADGQWRGFRVHMIGPPLCERFQVTLRRQPKSVWTLAKLEDAGWASSSQLGVLKSWLDTHKNFLIVGPTGSGKTSVLNACLQELPEAERVVCLEDTAELVPRAGASCKLLTRSDGNGVLRDYSLADLVRQSLRMRPTRLVIGEVRGGEAKDLLLALATGHKGSLGTLHATDARQALLRLEMLVQLSAGQWDHQAVRQLIQLSVDGIAVAGFSEGKRRLDGLFRIASLESFGFLVERVA
jgi:pilus assembly protein CpaF